MSWLNTFADQQQATSPWHDRLFVKLLLAALSIRFLVAVGLWLTVTYVGNHDPIFVLAERLRAIDAITYHKEAMGVLNYWRGDITTINTFVFSSFLAWLYRLVAAHPLAMSAFASICYLGVGLFAYGLAASLGRSRWQARAVSLIICLWPSSLAWSVLPLKEPPVLLAIFSFLFLLIKLGQQHWRQAATWLPVILGLAASVVVLVFLRPYLWYFLAAVTLMPLLGRLLPAKEVQRATWLGLVGATVVGVVIIGAALPLKQTTYIRYGQQEPVPPIVKSEPAPKPAPKAASRPRKDLSKQSWTEKMLNTLSRTRQKFAKHGGSSLSPEARRGGRQVSLKGQFDTWQESLGTVIYLLKAAARDLLLFPYPWQRWPSGPLRPATLLVAFQSIIWYLLLPGLAAGLFLGLRRRPGTALTIIAWGLGLGLVLGIAILNRGTMFRLREMALMPLILLWHPWPYEKLWTWIKPGSQR